MERKFVFHCFFGLFESQIVAIHFKKSSFPVSDAATASPNIVIDSNKDDESIDIKGLIIKELTEIRSSLS